jgi:hypothetical protein
MGCTPGHFQYRSLFFFYSPKGNGTILIKAKNRLINQSYICPAFILYSDCVTGTEGFVWADLLPGDLTCPPGLYGSLHGLLNGSTLAAVGAGWPGLVGIGVTALLLTLLLSAAVVPICADWGRIAIRVVGSWVAAVGLLMFGWLLQGAS